MSTQNMMPRPGWWLEGSYLASDMSRDPRFWPTTRELAAFYRVSEGAVRTKGEEQRLPAMKFQEVGGNSAWHFDPHGLPATAAAWRVMFTGGKKRTRPVGAPRPPRRRERKSTV